MKRFIYYLISGLLVLALGIFMIMQPDAFADAAIIIFSVYLIADGIRSLIYFLKVRKLAKALGVSLTAKGFVNLILGLIILIIALSHPSSTLTALVYVAATGFFIDALFDLVDFFITKKYSIAYSTAGMEALISIAIGTVLCLFPAAIGKLSIYLIAGVVLIVGTMLVSYGVHSLSISRLRSKIEKEVKEADVEFEEEK